MTKHFLGLASGGLLFIATQASIALFPTAWRAGAAVLILAAIGHAAIGYVMIGGTGAWKEHRRAAAYFCAFCAVVLSAAGVTASWLAGRLLQVGFSPSASVFGAAGSLLGLAAIDLYVLKHARQASLQRG